MRTPLLASLLLLAGCGAAPHATLATAPRAATQATPAPAAGYKAAEPAPSVSPAASPTASPEASPEADAATVVPAGVPFDVLTLNTWGKPGILGTDLKRRFRLIGQAIRGHDVVGLQETFTSRAEGLEGSAGYLTFVRPKNGRLFQVNSGLTVLAKHPLVETDFAPFEQAAAGDAFARKGVLFVRIEVPGVGPVDVYDTHFQAKAGDKYEAIRLHDAEVLVALVRRHEAGNPTFVLGDFNAKDGSAAFRHILAELPLRDSYAEAHPGTPGFTAGPENPYRKAGSAGKRIDYVLASGGARRELRIASAEVVLDQPIEGVVLSDHYGLNVKFTLLPR